MHRAIVYSCIGWRNIAKSAGVGPAAHPGDKQGVVENLSSNAAKALRAIFTRNVNIDCDCIPFQFDKVPVRKILNWILVEASIYAKRGMAWGWPTHLQIEPANYCNLRCALCPITDGMDRSSGIMSQDLFRKLVDETGKYVFIMMLWDWGEPFLNPGIYDMIVYAKQRGIKVVTSTNGHFFRTREQAERLVRSGLDSLIIAVDGINQETYQRYRGLGNLEMVTDGIRRIVAAKKALNLKTPLINLRFVVMKHNEQEVPKLHDFAQSLEVNLLTVRALHPHDAKGLLKGSPKGNQYLPGNPRHQRYRTASDGITLLRRNLNPCRKLWNSATVHWDGKVCPCCFDPHDRHTLGDLTKTGFREIWFGPRYRDIRRAFRQDYRSIAVCSDCSYAFEGGTLGTEDFVEAHFFGAK